jgi:hypothetical protein
MDAEVVLEPVTEFIDVQLVVDKKQPKELSAGKT